MLGLPDIVIVECGVNNVPVRRRKGSNNDDNGRLDTRDLVQLMQWWEVCRRCDKCNRHFVH